MPFAILALIPIVVFTGAWLASGYPHRLWCDARPNAPANGTLTVRPFGEIQVACCAKCNAARVRSRHAYLRENDLLDLDAARQDCVVFLEMGQGFDL